jgi:hypothetical protein
MNWTALALFVEVHRIHRGLTIAGAAASAGVSVGVLQRLRSFRPVSDANRDRFVAWIGDDLEVFECL